MKWLKWRSMLIVCLSLQAGIAMAQQNNDEIESAIDNLRERQPSDLDNQIIDDWVNAAMTKLDRELAGATPSEAAASFVKRFTDQYGNERNSVEFNIRFAERTGRVFLAEYKKENLADAKARALAAVLANLAAQPTRETLLAGLSSSDQAVRYLSAKALTRIKEDIAADARLTGVVLEAIAKAGAAEPNEPAAAIIYEACEYPDHADDSIAAILTMLDGRLDRMKNAAHGLGRADLHAIRFLDSLSPSNDQKAEIVRRLATLLRIHVMRYLENDVPDSERAAIQETIDESEALIRKLVNPSDVPSVSGKMQSGGAAAATEMQIELNRWIGTEQDEGILNRSPWDVPRGAE